MSHRERNRRTANVFYVPWETGIDQMIAAGAAWLRTQPGDRLVFLMAKNIYARNPLLPRLTAGAEVATPTSRYKTTWRRGPVLVPWPDERVLTAVDHLDAAGVCVLPWGEDAYTHAWLAARGAVDLLTREALAPRDDLLSPVVTIAMETLSHMVNHANGLLGYERDLAIRTLTALVGAGYRFEVDALVAWALANGFTGSETQRLRDYASKALAGHRFRLGRFGGLRPDIVHVWEQEARERGLVAAGPEPDPATPRSRDW